MKKHHAFPSVKGIGMHRLVKPYYWQFQGAFFKIQLQQLVSLLRDMDVSIAPMERLYIQNTHLEKHLGSAKHVQKVIISK